MQKMKALIYMLAAILCGVAGVGDSFGAECFDYGDSAGSAPGARLGGMCDTSDVCVSGGVAYVAGLCNLWVIDVSNPLEPQVAGVLGMTDQCLGVAVKDGYAFVLDLNHGLRVVDIADPANLEVVASLATVGEPVDIVIKGTHALITNNLGFSGSLLTVDIANPLAPRIVKTLAMPDLAMGLALVGPYAYVACWEAGLQIVEVYDPRYPRLAGLAGTPQRAWRLGVSGDYAYVTVAETGLMVVDIDSPWFPVTVSYLPGLENAWDIEVAGSHAYVGSHVVNIEDPNVPWVVGELETPGQARAMAQLENHLLVTEYDPGGLSILKLQCEALSAIPSPSTITNFQLGQNHPNPFNPMTTITYDVPKASRVSIRIYDISGRLVRRLIAGDTRPAGRHEAAWRGKDDQGQQVAAGVYFYQFDAGGFIETKRMTLVK